MSRGCTSDYPNRQLFTRPSKTVDVRYQKLGLGNSETLAKNRGIEEEDLDNRTEYTTEYRHYGIASGPNFLSSISWIAFLCH